MYLSLFLARKFNCLIVDRRICPNSCRGCVIVADFFPVLSTFDLTNSLEYLKNEICESFSNTM